MLKNAPVISTICFSLEENCLCRWLNSVQKQLTLRVVLHSLTLGKCPSWLSIMLTLQFYKIHDLLKSPVERWCNNRQVFGSSTTQDFHWP